MGREQVPPVSAWGAGLRARGRWHASEHLAYGGVEGQLQQGAEGGVGFALRIKEHNPKGPWWYDSFTLECGIPGPCTREVLEAWKKEIDSNRRALRDPCGSARIQSLQWETGRMPDALHPEEVRVDFLLSVPPIDPTEAPGTETCPDAQ